MIGANAVAAELAIQMLDHFDLSGWKFSGEATSQNTTGGQARVVVTPPELPPGTGYYVLVNVNEDEPLAPQLDAAIAQLSKLLSEPAAIPAGKTPDEALDAFFAGLSMPPELAEQKKQGVLAVRHPKEAPRQEAPPQ